MELKPRLRYCDHFGNVRANLTMEETKQLVRDVREEMHAPMVLTKSSAPDVEALAARLRAMPSISGAQLEAAMKGLLDGTASAMRTLEARIAALEE